MESFERWIESSSREAGDVREQVARAVESDTEKEREIRKLREELVRLAAQDSRLEQASADKDARIDMLSVQVAELKAEVSGWHAWPILLSLPRGRRSTR